jgi:SAM-dependent methyltransferase
MNKLIDIFKSIKLPKNRYINNTYLKLVILLIILYFVFQLLRKNTEETQLKEGFGNKREKIKTKKEITEIYDDFYSSIYDDLVYDPNKNNFELQEIIRATKMKQGTSTVLDIGSGNGHHLELLRNKGIDTIGLEISPSMIQRANTLYPNINIKQGDVIDSNIFRQETFSHILTLYFTLYYIKDKQTYFNNCYKWLKPGGILAVHLVNREMFNPIVNAGDPFVMVSPQKYAKDRITKTVVKFKDFKYKSNFSLDRDNNVAYFEELFRDDKTKDIRQNKHIFYMDKQKDIIRKAKQSGFNLLGKIDLINAKYEYQYIYILQK